MYDFNYDEGNIIGIRNPTKAARYADNEKNNLHVRPVLYNGKGNIMGKKMWLHCASTLHADSVHYAAYPNGTYFEPDEILPDGRCIFKGRSGELHILWQDKDTREEYLKNGIIL